MIKVKIIEDSLNTYGNRLTTFELEYPRYIHAEVLTHRVFSRNAQSSRAIPVQTMIDRVRNNKLYPVFMQNKKGMSAEKELDTVSRIIAAETWDAARESALSYAEELTKQGVHKQIVNRLLEPFSTITVILSGTEFENFLKLRIASDAQQEIQELAVNMKVLLQDSLPNNIKKGEWHLPYILDDEKKSLPLESLLKISTARCARVSYLKHNNARPSVKDDIQLHDRLLKSRHMSPFEHIATPDYEAKGNFKHFRQYRQEVENND
jgi:thymidylate synthase ThyX